MEYKGIIVENQGEKGENVKGEDRIGKKVVHFLPNSDEWE